MAPTWPARSGSTTYGVAKSVTIHPVRIFDCAGSASASDVVLGLEYIVDDHLAGQPAVLNLSIGGNANSLEDAAVQAVIDDGITVVVAAGNDGAPACNHTPARLPAAVTVAATDITDSSPDFSSWGPCLDLFAPGVDITSLGISSRTATAVKTGTSMASPHVAGVAALLLQQSPSATPAQVAAQIAGLATPNLVANPRPGSPNLLLYSSPSTQSLPPSFSPMSPARLFDSRPGSPTVDGQGAGIGTARAPA